MTTKYDNAPMGFDGSRVPLPVGVYGDREKPGLTIVSYLGNRPTKTEGLERRSFLVTSTGDVEGTAFMVFQWKETWLSDAALSLAFNKPEWAEQQDRDTFERESYATIGKELAEAGAPAEDLEKMAEKKFDNLKTQIRINVGMLFRLQDWAGADRNPKQNLIELVGAEFSGKVVAGLMGASEVELVMSKKK